MKWFRFYSEFRSDPKMRRMPIQHRYAFIVLLCLAGESENRGVITGLDDDDIAYELEMSTEDWLTLKAKFRVKGLIEFEQDSIIINSWDKRQFESDSSAARVAKHRKSAKKRACNVTQSLPKRYVTPSDTDSYSDSDTKTETENTRPIQEREEADSIALDSVFAVECEATQEELPLVPRDSESETDLVKKTGGRKPKKTTCSEGDFEAFREIYNDRKPDMWAEMQIVNPSRQKILNQLAIDCDGKENAIAALANALDYARQDQWYLTKALSFENFATNNKILRLHEQQVARSPRKDEAVRFASNPANMKSFQNRQSIKQAMEEIANGSFN